MKIEQTPLKDCFVLTPAILEDERGTFYETYNKNLFKKVTGLDVNFVQDNQSTSRLGVLRGLHYQAGTMAQAKLVRVLEGHILDDVKQQQLFVPRGFAHGFVTLSPKSTFAYKCDNLYDKSSERGIIYSDATLQLDWHLPNDKFIISEKDLKLPSFLEAIAE